MAPFNRRGFFARLAALPLAAIAIKTVRPRKSAHYGSPAPQMLTVEEWPYGTHFKTHDGANIIGMESIGDDLFVFSETSVYRVTSQQVSRL